MLCNYLKLLKETSGMTIQQISEKSSVPISTIERILNGKTEQPSFNTVCDLVLTMGGSIDSYLGLKESEPMPHHAGSCDVKRCAIIELYERQKQQDEEWKNATKIANDEHIERVRQFYKDLIDKNEAKHESTLQDKMRTIRILSKICIGMIIFLGGLVTAEFLFGSVGLIRF